MVDSFSRGANGIEVRLTGGRTVVVDHIAAFTGFRPNGGILRELTVETSPVTEGSARLYRAIANVTDCLTVPRVSVDDLWAAWKAWAEDQSQHHGTKQTFGRDLRAVVPGLHVSRPRDGEHKRTYVGVALAAEGNSVADRGPRGPSEPDDAPGPHGPRTSGLFSQRPAPDDAGPDPELPANDDGWPGDGTGPSEEGASPTIVLTVTRVTLVTVFCLLLRLLTSMSPARRCGSSPTT